MSRIQQLNFLKRLRNELEESSKEYRELTGNKLSHDFLVTEASLAKALTQGTMRIAKDMKNQNLKEQSVKEWVLKTFKKDFEVFITELHKKFENYKGKSSILIINKTTYSIEAEFRQPEEGSIDIFGAIQTLYDKPLEKLYNAFEEGLKKRLKVDELKYKTEVREKGKKPEIVSKDLTRGFIFQLEHDNVSVNATSNVDLFIANAFNKTSRGRFTKQGAQSIALYLGMQKNLHFSKPSVAKVFLGSGIVNNAESSEERARRTNLLKKLQEEITRLGNKYALPIANAPGSDSLVESKRKAALKTLDKTFSKSKKKNIKTSFKESSKLDKGNSAGKPVTLDVSGKITKVKNKNYKTPKARNISLKPSRQDFTSLNFLIGVINQQLPRTVAKNMGDPRLNYRTGRFASSVEVTDITTTAKGFPSIGYTYDKFPYQTFEPGYRQGSVDRDPRKLIDTSIREIAAQFAIGRFYTRRV